MSGPSIGSTRGGWSGSRRARVAARRRGPAPRPDPRRRAGYATMKYIHLVLRNMTRNKRRLALTVMSIAVSLFVFSALVSLPAVANQVLASSASSERLVCHNKAGLTYGLPEAYKQKIVLVPHIEAVVSQSWFGGMYHKPTDQFPNFAI